VNTDGRGRQLKKKKKIARAEEGRKPRCKNLREGDLWGGEGEKKGGGRGICRETKKPNTPAGEGARATQGDYKGRGGG